MIINVVAPSFTPTSTPVPTNKPALTPKPEAVSIAATAVTPHVSGQYELEYDTGEPSENTEVLSFISDDNAGEEAVVKIGIQNNSAD